MAKRMIRGGVLWRAVGVMLAVVLLSACGGQAPPIPPTSTPIPTPEPEPDVLQLFYWQSPTTLNPHLSTNLFDWDAARITYEPLASFDAEGELVPFLAADIPSLENGGVAEDGLSVTWQLKEAVQWADGEPFTAEDVRFTYEFITNPAVNSSSSSAYEEVAEVEIIDDHTVTVHFTEVNPAWSLPFVGISGMILPEHIFQAYNGFNAPEAPANEIAVGTGPYNVAKFQTEAVLFLGTELIETKKIVYEPNEFFWDEASPAFSQIILKGGSDAEEAAYMVLETGDGFDFAANLQNPDDLVKFEQLGHARLITQPGSRIERILLNRTDPDTPFNGERSSVEVPHPILSDKAVREALSLAINREAVAQFAGFGSEPTSNNLVSPPRYDSPNTSYEYNLDKAAALLEEAGWVDSDGDGIRDKEGVEMRLTFQTTVGNSLRQQVQRMVREALGQIGVEVRLEVIDSSILFGEVSNPNQYRRFQADMQLYREGNRSPDPGGYMRFWTCDQIPQRENNWTGENIERWCNETYDDLYAQSTREIDPEARQALFIQMNDLLIEDVVMIPLIKRATAHAVGNDIVGLEPTPWDSILWNIKDWRREPGS